MKKIALLFGMASILVLTSCSNSKNETASEKDTIVQQVEESDHTTTTTTTEVKTNDDGTTIEADEKGVTYETKTGKNQTRVKVTTDSAKIKIKR